MVVDITSKIDEINELNSQMLDAALSYAKLGLPVVFLRRQSKQPRFEDWQQRATTDPAKLKATWESVDLDGNVGIAMGRGTTKIIDLECDSDDAAKEYHELFNGNPPTVPTFAGRRGKHHLFRWREGLPDKAFFHAGNVEVRLGNGDRGAQSVFPPSIHPDGVQYEWVPGLSIHDVSPGDLPDDVVAKLVALCKTQPKKADGKCDLESDSHEVAISRINVAVAEREKQAKRWLEACPGTQAGIGGQVNEKVSGLAIHLLWGFALPAEKALGLLTEWGQRPDQTDANGRHYPWTEHEIARKVDWALGQQYGGTVGDRLYRSTVVDDSGLVEAFARTVTPAAAPVTTTDVVHDAGKSAPPPAPVSTMDTLHADIREAEKRKRRKNRKGYSIQALDSLPPAQWQIAEHWTVGGLNCIYGPPSSGKSFIALDQALCIATGKPYLNKYAVKQGAVCYVAAEGASGIRKRIQAWLKYYRITPPSNVCVIPSVFNLLEKDEAAVLAEIARETLGTNPVAVFIDTLARNFGGGDENSTKDMNQFIDTVSHLGRLCAGASVYVLHHTGKDFTKGARGSIALTGACDSMVSVTGGPRSCVELHCTKQKDAPEFRVYSVETHHVTTDNGEDSLVLVQESNWKARLRVLNDGQRELFNALLNKHAMKPFSFSEGQVTAGGVKSTYQSRMKGLEDLQLVHKNDKGDYFLDSQAVGASLLA